MSEILVALDRWIEGGDTKGEYRQALVDFRKMLTGEPPYHTQDPIWNEQGECRHCGTMRWPDG